MTNRPEILFPLHISLTSLDGIGPGIERKMRGLSIEKPLDLLLTLPISGIKRELVDTVFMYPSGRYVVVEVTIVRHQPGRSKQTAYKVIVQDKEVSFNLVFFHARKDHLNKVLPVGEKRIISGKLELFDGIQQIVHPEYIIQPSEKIKIERFQAIYPLTAGITQKIMRKSLHSALQLLPELEEWIDPSLKKSRSWPDWSKALKLVHEPTSEEAVAPTYPARERLSYDELYAHQLTLAIARVNNRKKVGRKTVGTGDLVASALDELDFKLTKSISNYLSYRYGIREIQDGNSKSVIDYKIMMQRDRWKVTLNMNNIFDSKYYETNLVQMPGRNITVGLNIEI